MGITYSKILRKVDSGEIDILKGVVKTKLGEEYLMDELETVLIGGWKIDQRYQIPTNIIKYKADERGEVVFDKPNILLEVYLKVIGLKNGEITTKDVHMGDFASGKIAKKLGAFKRLISTARDQLYDRLKTMNQRINIYKHLKDEGHGVTNLGYNDSPCVFDLDLYNELKNAAKDLFSD